MTPDEWNEKLKGQIFSAETEAAEDVYQKARQRASGALMFGATAIVQRTDKGAVLRVRSNDPVGARGRRVV